MSSTMAAAAAAAAPGVVPASVALPPSEFLSIGRDVKEKLAQLKAARQAAKSKRADEADQLQLSFFGADDSSANAFAHSVHDHALGKPATAAAAQASLATPVTAAATAAASPAPRSTPSAGLGSNEDFISFGTDDSLATPSKQSGHKRKAGELDDESGAPTPAAGAGARAPQMEGAFKAPWATCAYSHPSFTVRLHEELLDFCSYVSPKPAEQSMREELIGRLDAMVKEAFPNSPNVHMKPFGSYATKLYLPISDIDLVLFGVDEPRFASGEKGKNSPLGVLERVMRSKQNASYLEHISGARIPILKLTDKATGVKVDICYNIEGGLRAAEFIVHMQHQMPALRPLTLFLKYFLHCRILNDTYKGGIGSFMLQLMLINHLQGLQLAGRLQHPTTNLGMLLMSFLEAYGISINYKNAGLNMNAAQNGAAASSSDRNSSTLHSSSSSARTSFFNKSSRGWFNANRPYLLSIENPLDPNHDVGSNSYLILRVRKALQFAYQILSAHVYYDTLRVERGEPLIRKQQRHDLSRAVDPAHPFAAPSHTPQTLLSHIVSVNEEIRAGQQEVDYEEMEQQQQREEAQMQQRQAHVHTIDSSSGDEEDEEQLGKRARTVPASLAAPDFTSVDLHADLQASSSDSDSSSADDAALDSASDDDKSPSAAMNKFESQFADPDGGDEEVDMSASSSGEDDEEDEEDDSSAAESADALHDPSFDELDDLDVEGMEDLADLDDGLDSNNQRTFGNGNTHTPRRSNKKKSNGSSSSSSSHGGAEDYISLSGFSAPPSSSGRSIGGGGGGSAGKPNKKGKGYQFDNSSGGSVRKRKSASSKKKSMQQGVRTGGTKPNNGIFESGRSKERKSSKKKHDKQQRKKQRT